MSESKKDTYSFTVKNVSDNAGSVRLFGFTIKSREGFPLAERHVGVYKLSENPYSIDSVMKLVMLVNRYLKALLIAEQQLIDLGAEKLYYKKHLTKPKLDFDGYVNVKSSKITYYHWISELKELKLAIKDAEKQIEKILISKCEKI